jgi:type VII secretion-associated serine protease mycosin
VPFRQLQFRRVAVTAALGCLLVALTPDLAGAVGPRLPAAKGPCDGQATIPQISGTPWPLQRLQPMAAWPLSRGRGVTVAVIDSGVFPNHPMLQGRVLPGTDMIPGNGGGGDCDKDGHGTLVAGVIAGRSDQSSPGVYGVAPDARILPIRVLPDHKRSDAQDLPERIAQAIDYAVAQHVDVINLSLTTTPIEHLIQAINNADAQNIVVVAAAGNTGQTPFPALANHVIAVGGIGQNGQHASDSLTGDPKPEPGKPNIDLGGPDLGVGPAPRSTGYVSDRGSSFAAAYVSGVAALIRAYDPKLKPAEVERRMELTADIPPGGRNNEVGYGMVNPYRALTTVLYKRNDVVPAATGTLPRAVAATDPLASVKVTAGWMVAAGVLLATALFLGSLVINRGRSRRWRPADPRAGRV